ncbi:PD-(D/E)XK nuclease family protein [Mesorhizobium sp. ES1-3]|uniref:PD-(D/E)XK nuclease family protein n=1 Tax=Mesorhizobium sp. ES1-3 TaxID=2876628 RepID=UPI001CCC5300|nr:PD-(D/E)XK nuclease family protein [Mesorhizobium sp. ES1-3]MBZ9673797.1 PD-(D/E)XK nuclease family protein [Mesorhizobium sp. ES1-3]
MTNSLFAVAFLEATLAPRASSVLEVTQQAGHIGSTGTIDLDVRLSGNRRLLIENKINAKYSVTDDGDQPSRYRKTADVYRGYGIACQTVLVAPSIYLKARGDVCGFDLKISYETLSDWLQGDDLALVLAATEQARTPYIGETVEANTMFFSQYAELVAREFPSLTMKKSPNADGGRPGTSRSIYFNVRKTLTMHPGVPRPRMSIQCWEQAQPSPSVKIMLGKWASLSERLPLPHSLADVGGYLRPANQSLGIAIDTPLMFVERALSEQLAAVRQGLDAAVRLQNWWKANESILRGWAQIASKGRQPG